MRNDLPIICLVFGRAQKRQKSVEMLVDTAQHIHMIFKAEFPPQMWEPPQLRSSQGDIQQ